MNRLETIKSMVSKCETAADIGTDHGYVAEMLLTDNTAKKVIATDLNKGPLNRAIEYMTSKKLNLKCDFRLGSGLTVLQKNESDAIIIAGMGGELIADILSTSKDIAFSAKQLILQPMTAYDKLRKFLYENGYKVTDENIVKELHHYYFVIKAEPGRDKIDNEIYYEISKHLLDKKDPVMYEYIEKLIKTNNKIIQSLEGTGNIDYKEKIDKLKYKNNIIMELIKK